MFIATSILRILCMVKDMCHVKWHEGILVDVISIGGILKQIVEPKPGFFLDILLRLSTGGQQFRPSQSCG